MPFRRQPALLRPAPIPMPRFTLHASARAAALALCAAPFLTTSAWAIRLNDSGLTQCQGTNGEFSSVCAGSGQDGEFGRDYGDPNHADGTAGFRFAKVCHSGERAGQGACPADPALGPGPSDWGCTRDDVTGILWEIKTTDNGLRDWHGSYTRKAPGEDGYGAKYDAAGFVQAVNAIGLCGYTDWKLPTPTALHSLVHYGIGVKRDVPTIDERFFPNTWYGANWASLYAADDPTQSWFVHFDTNYIGRSEGTIFKRIRLARDDNHTKSLKYVVSADGQEVTDARTKLVWRRCVEGQAWDGATCTGTPTTFTWRQALAHANAASAGGWRLPSAKELVWLADRSRFSPSIDPVAFPATPAAKHWTSTPIVSIATQAWHVEFDIGEAYRSSQNAPMVIRLVR